MSNQHEERLDARCGVVPFPTDVVPRPSIGRLAAGSSEKETNLHARLRHINLEGWLKAAQHIQNDKTRAAALAQIEKGMGFK